MSHRVFQLFRADWPFFQRPHESRTEFFFVKRLSDAIALNDPRHNELCRLKRGKPLTASQTLPTTANLMALCNQARIVDLRLTVGAKGAMHRAISSISLDGVLDIVP